MQLCQLRGQKSPFEAIVLPKKAYFLKFHRNIGSNEMASNFLAIFETRIRRMRTRIQRMRRTWGTRRIQRIQRIQRIWRIQRTRRIRRTRRIWRIQRIRRIPYTIFKRFFSFIYSATKGFISSSKLSSELYLAEA